jgi:hypothetical protein
MTERSAIELVYQPKSAREAEAELVAGILRASLGPDIRVIVDEAMTALLDSLAPVLTLHEDIGKLQRELHTRRDRLVAEAAERWFLAATRSPHDHEAIASSLAELKDALRARVDGQDPNRFTFVDTIPTETHQEISLVTDTGGYVATIGIPRTQTLPIVLLFGVRCFRLIPDPDESAFPLYRETSCYRVPLGTPVAHRSEDP